MANPFDAGIVDLSKKVKPNTGVQNPNQTSKPEDKDKKALGSTDVFTYAGAQNTNWGNMDGFERTGSSSKTILGNEDHKEELENGKKQTEETKSLKGKAQDASEQSQDDIKTDGQNNRKVKQAASKTQQTVTKNNNEKENLENENETVKTEIEALNSEIQTLMEEDGQNFTPQEIPETGANPFMPNPAQGGGSQDGGVESGLTMGGADTGAAGTQGAMLSSNSGAQPQGGLTAPVSPSQGQAQTPAAMIPKNTASQGAGGNLRSFTASLPSGKGKNADKIAELSSQVSAKSSTMTSNISRITALKGVNSNSIKTFNTQYSSAKAVTTKHKASANDSQKLAKAAQVAGQSTTTLGAGLTATGMAMQANIFGGQALAAPFLIAGASATVTGTATTTAAGALSGDANNALNSAAGTLNQLGTQAGLIKGLKA